MGTTGREHDRRPPGFHGPVGGLPNAPETGAPCQPSGPFSERVDSRAVRDASRVGRARLSGRKRTLLGASTGVPGLPRVAASVRPPPRFGDLDPIPFRPRARPPSSPCEEAGVRWPPARRHPCGRRRDRATRDRTPSERDLPYALGSTNPCPTAVHMEPFPTSALKAPV